jgi:thioredoxin-related protein
MMKMPNKVRLMPLLTALTLPLLLLKATFALAEGISMPVAKDMQQDGIRAMEQGIPILVEFSMVGCPFCEQVEEEILKPMLLSGLYENKVIIRKLVIDYDESVTDFNGQKLSYEDFASRYRIDVVPTLVLMDGKGEALGLRMRGVTTIDFYGAYLDQAIDQALGLTSRKIRPASRGTELKRNFVAVVQ